jgi:hypothetical protein
MMCSMYKEVGFSHDMQAGGSKQLEVHVYVQCMYI